MPRTRDGPPSENNAHVFTRNPRGVLRHGNEVGPTNYLAPGLRGRLLAPLTRGEMGAVENASRSFINIAGSGCRLGDREFNMLRSNECLNDEIVNSSLALLAERSFSPLFNKSRSDSRGKPLALVASTFLYAKLMERGLFQYGRVKTWTKKRLEYFDVSFTTLDLFIVPCHINSNHWAVCVIYLRERTIVYYDPLGGKGEEVLPNIYKWLSAEFEVQGIDSEKLTVQTWPLQINPVSFPSPEDGVSCGIFIMFVCEAISRGDQPCFKQNDVHLLRKKTILFLLDKKIPIQM